MLRSLLLLLLILFISCTENHASKSSGNAAPHDSSAVKPAGSLPSADSLIDEMASVIAGADPVSRCRDLVPDKKWTSYKENIKGDWDLVEKNKTRPISRWRDKNLGSDSAFGQALFYPFAGADFLYANAFFPTASSYILVGLEPVGKLHRCDTMAKKDFLAYLEKIRSALYFSNHLGFFRTKSMETDLNQQSLDGTLPLIVFYIRKTGHHLTAISYFNIDKNGASVACRQDTSTIGVRVSFCDSAMNNRQDVYYLSYDLSDKNLARHPEFLQFIRSFGAQNCFLKAAFYLMFTSEFNVMRNFLLENESAILQDDSGIPYRYFKPGGWSVNLFGSYTQTIDLFKYKFQPDLLAAYEKQVTQKAVPFRIGYNVKFNETNLLFAKRKR